MIQQIIFSLTQKHSSSMIVRERLPSSPSTPKVSTSELKLALQKIKQTQMEVLKVLKHEGENSNINEVNIKQISQNIDAHLPYIRSISHINLLKMTEIESMRKESERQKQKNRENIERLMQQIKQLEKSLKVKSQSQISEPKQNKNDSQNHDLNGQHIGKEGSGKIQSLTKRLNNSEKELQMKNQQIERFKARQNQLQKKRKDILKEKENYRLRYEEVIRQNEFQMLTKADRNGIPPSFYTDIRMQIKKMAESHDKMYRNFKEKARLYRLDLQLQEQFKESWSNALKKLQHYQQKYRQHKNIIQNDSIINRIKISNQQSSEHITIIDKQQNKEAALRKQINQLLSDKHRLNKEISQLREEFQLERFQAYHQKAKYQSHFEQIRRQLEEKVVSFNDKVTENKQRQYTFSMQGLQKQMKAIQEQKAILSAMLKKISENALRSSSQSLDTKTIKDNLVSLIQLNTTLRDDNTLKSKENNLLQIQIQKTKCQKIKLQERIEESNRIIDKEVNKTRFVLESKGMLEQELREKHVTVVKKQQKIRELGFIIDGNIRKYENETKMKGHEINRLSLQIEKHMKELRQLREMAFNHEVALKENKYLKSKIYHVNSNVIHLWEVKEAQYQNIYKIISAMNVQ